MAATGRPNENIGMMVSKIEVVKWNTLMLSEAPKMKKLPRIVTTNEIMPRSRFAIRSGRRSFCGERGVVGIRLSHPNSRSLTSVNGTG